MCEFSDNRWTVLHVDLHPCALPVQNESWDTRITVIFFSDELCKINRVECRFNISFYVFEFLLQLCVTAQWICVSPPHSHRCLCFMRNFYLQRIQTHLNQRREIEPQVHMIYSSPKIVKMIDGEHCAMRGNLLTRNIYVKWAQSVNSTNSFFVIFVVCAQRARITITSK